MTTPATSEKERVKDAGKKYAANKVDETFANSNIKDKSSYFPKFTKEELKLGKVLGKGGFGTVYEVKGFDATANSRQKVSSLKMIAMSTRNLMSSFNSVDDDEEVNAGQMEYREFIAEHCIRGNGDARYAVKVLSPSVINDPGTFIQGSIDMAVETRILSSIEHPNIIKMRALAKVSPFSEEYFIVMDRLYDTMEGRISKWEKRQKKLKGVGGKLFDRKGDKKKELLEEIMVASYDLSDALGYLHGKKIIYRDIKPENIGFDIRDDVKILYVCFLVQVFFAILFFNL
jgi:serine/threonine protein kinase